MDERKVHPEESTGEPLSLSSSSRSSSRSFVSQVKIPSPVEMVRALSKASTEAGMHNPDNVPNSIEIRKNQMFIKAQRILPTEVDVSVANVVAVRGPMFASKTDLTIRAIQAFFSSDMRVLVVRPKTDTRGESDLLVAHNKHESPRLSDGTFWCNRTEDVYKHIKKMQKKTVTGRPIRVVVVDEAQFMKDRVSDWMWKIANAIKGVVWINGLNTDSNNRTWGSARWSSDLTFYR